MHTLALVALSAAGAGVVHVVSGPDHLAAVAPLATEAPKRATLVGASWGLGHAAGSWVIGVGAVATGLQVNVPVVAAFAERGVAVLLICLGAWGLVKARTTADHHPAAQQTGPRVALHVGLFHGVAGSAQLLGILPALLVPTLVGKLVFLAVFGLSAAATMTAVATAVGSGVALIPRRRVLQAASALSIGVGVIWALRSGP